MDRYAKQALYIIDFVVFLRAYCFFIRKAPRCFGTPAGKTTGVSAWWLKSMRTLGVNLIIVKSWFDVSEECEWVFIYHVLLIFRAIVARVFQGGLSQWLIRLIHATILTSVFFYYFRMVMPQLPLNLVLSTFINVWNEFLRWFIYLLVFGLFIIIW